LKDTTTLAEHYRWYRMLGSVLALLGITFLLLTALSYALHTWRGQYCQEHPLIAVPGSERLDPQLITRVGHFLNPMPNHFLTYPDRKEPGVYRIGCFGDSFTYGAEVEPPWDYPAQLQSTPLNSNTYSKETDVWSRSSISASAATGSIRRPCWC